MKQPPEVSLLLYADLVETAPSSAFVPARALRDKGRAGQLKDEHLAPLIHCLYSAPNLLCVVDIAKALASLGREAQPAIPTVIKKLLEINVVDDESFWGFDSLLYVLGFLGGDEAVEALQKIQAEEIPRPLKAKSVYRGEWDEETRSIIYRDSILRTIHMAAKKDFVGGWTKRQTDHSVDEEESTPPPKMSPWMTR